MVSTSQKIRFHQQEQVLSSIDWFPIIAVTVSASSKKLLSKVTVFISEQNLSPIAGMKDTFKNTFPLDRKKGFLLQKSLKNT